MKIKRYARTYKVFKSRANMPSTSTGLGSTVNKEGAPGEYTQINGILSYFEVCTMLANHTAWHQTWLNIERVPYAQDDQETIMFYENPESVEAKASYVRANDLGGIGFFSLDMDDFTGLFCHSAPFPLVHTARDVYNPMHIISV